MPKTPYRRTIYYQPPEPPYTGEGDSPNIPRYKIPGEIGGWTIGPGPTRISSQGVVMVADSTNAYLSFGVGAADITQPPASITDGAGTYIDQTGFYGLFGSLTTLSLTSADGVIKVGSDVSSAATTYFVVAGSAITVGLDDLSAGDVVIGSSANGIGNLHFNTLTGQLEIRGGLNVQGYIDTTGALSFGAGNVIVDASGINIIAPSAKTTTNVYGFTHSGTLTGSFYTVWQTSPTTGPRTFIDSYGLTNGDASAISLVASTADLYQTILLLSQAGSEGAGYAAFYTGSSVFSGLTIGNSGAPNATLDVRGTAIVTSSLIMNTAALATNATDGFFYADACAGAPTGTPTTHTGRIPMIFDSTNNYLYAFLNSAWKKVLLA